MRMPISTHVPRQNKSNQHILSQPKNSVTFRAYLLGTTSFKKFLIKWQLKREQIKRPLISPTSQQSKKAINKQSQYPL